MCVNGRIIRCEVVKKKERVNASVLQEQDAMREIAKAASYSEAMGDGLREIRIFSNIFMLLMGVESSALSSRVDRVADGLAQTSKSAALSKMQPTSARRLAANCSAARDPATSTSDPAFFLTDYWRDETLSGRRTPT